MWGNINDAASEEAGVVAALAWATRARGRCCVMFGGRGPLVAFGRRWVARRASRALERWLTCDEVRLRVCVPKRTAGFPEGSRVCRSLERRGWARVVFGGGFDMSSQVVFGLFCRRGKSRTAVPCVLFSHAVFCSGRRCSSVFARFVVWRCLGCRKQRRTPVDLHQRGQCGDCS